MPRSIYIFGILIFCVVHGISYAQPADSLQFNSKSTLLQKLDSLQQEIDLIRTQLETDTAKPDSVKGIDNLLRGKSPDSTLLIEDQRSRRKRVDELLEEYMKRPGVVNFNGDATAIFQTQKLEDEYVTTATGSYDLFVASRLGERTLFFINLEAIGGDGPNANIQSFSSLNEDAGSTQTADGLDRMHVLEVWTEFAALGDALNFTVGKIDLTNYFDNNYVANDETSQFISGAFVNSAALAIPGNRPGFRMRAEIRRKFFLQAGVISRDNSGNNIFDNLFTIVSTGFRLGLTEKINCTYRIYGYFFGKNNEARGIGFSLDQPVSSRFDLFGRWTYNNSETAAIFGLENSWSTGIQWKTSFLKQSLRMAAAFGVNHATSELLLRERIFEFYIRQQLNRWTFVSSHLQIIDNAAGMNESYTILGIRTQFNF